jgi:hypothetical protein
MPAMASKGMTRAKRKRRSEKRMGLSLPVFEAAGYPFYPDNLFL